MRLLSAAIGLLLLFGNVGICEDTEIKETAETPEGETVLEEETPEPATEIPKFEPFTPKKAHFFDLFDRTEVSPWVQSGDDKFSGEFELSSGTLQGIEGDVGLVTPEPARLYGISVPFETKFTPLDEDSLVVQYEMRLHENLECGGAYVKFLADEGRDFDPATYTNTAPYSIMFGPDKCGSTNKVHFIFTFKNPKTGEWAEHHLQNPPMIKNDRDTHVYTLVINKDDTFEMLIDQESVSSGSLLDKFDPPVVPPKEIDDESDEMPQDWDDREKIPDETATKPDDWDEDAPQFVTDEEAIMPEDRLVDEPDMVADPDVEMPEDWDVEDDGDWEAPLIDNPKCKEVGCGPWSRPEIENPAYKGKWSAPLIENSAYQGVWAPRKIPNPDYFEGAEPFKQLRAIIGVGIDIWTMQAGIAYDNFYVGSDLADAKEFAANTWAIKKTVEEALRPKEEAPESGLSADNLLTWMKDNILENDKGRLIAVAGLLGIIPILFFLCRSSEKKSAGKPTPVKKDAVVSEVTESVSETEGSEGSSVSVSGNEGDIAAASTGLEQEEKAESQMRKRPVRKTKRRAD
eukprot:52470_1